MRVHLLRAFMTYLLVHIHQMKKVALQIAAKFASVNGPIFAARTSVIGKVNRRWRNLCQTATKVVNSFNTISPANSTNRIANQVNSS